jgi:thymidine kinase
MARLEVGTGPMFSGKSYWLIGRLRLASYAKRVLGIKPKTDTRDCGIVSHKNDGDSSKPPDDLIHPAFEVGSVEEFCRLIEEHNPDIVGIDEAQFLTPDFVPFIKKLLGAKEYQHLVIIIAGVDMTSEGDPFGPMPDFMNMADNVTKLQAVCSFCREWPPTANMSYFKKGKKTGPVLVGGAKEYGACCRKCWLTLQE